VTLRLFNRALLCKAKTSSGLRLLAGVAASVLLPLRAFATDTLRTVDPLQLDSVPEPDTLALVGATVAVIAVIMLLRRKRRGK
jgi:hypothetical protein